MIKKEIVIIGLGKMGAGLAGKLLESKWRVVGFNQDKKETKKLSKKGLVPSTSVKNATEKIKKPRLIWIMVPSGRPIAQVSHQLLKVLSKGDTIIDGGNSFYKESLKRAQVFKKQGIHFIDVGVSGGPKGARSGSCLMIGGTKKKFKELEPLYKTLAVRKGYAHFEGPGAGHFVKMVHNGIEYGMMQAIAEGFAIMKKSRYKLKIRTITEVYGHGSVIESRLVAWLNDAYRMYGEELKQITGAVAHSGEAEWTVKTARELNVAAPIIKGSLDFRKQSQKSPSYTGKILSAIRNQFGGHPIKN